MTPAEIIQALPQIITVPAMLTIFAVILYYFGKIVCQAKTDRETRFDIYLSGAFFVLFQILMWVIFYIFSVYALKHMLEQIGILSGWSVSAELLIFAQGIFVMLLFPKYVNDYKEHNPFEKLDSFETLRWVAVIYGNDLWSRMITYFAYVGSLFVTLTFLIYSNKIYSWYGHEAIQSYQILSILAEFIILTMFAYIMGASDEGKQKQIKVGKRTARLLRDDGKWLILYKDDELIYVNLDKYTSYTKKEMPDS